MQQQPPTPRTPTTPPAAPDPGAEDGVFAGSEAEAPQLGDDEPVYDEEPGENVPGSFLAALPQFFVFPLILVGSLTAIYLLLRVLAGFDEPTARDMLERVQSASASERWYELHSMAQRLASGRLDMSDISGDELERFYRGTLASLEAGGTNPAETEQTRLYALLFVAQSGDPRFTDLAVAELGAESPLLRQGALRALAILGDPSALESIRPFLTSADDGDRLQALLAVSTLAAGEAPGCLPARDVLAELIGDADPNIAQNAALQLGLAGDERALSVVGHLLSRASYGSDGGVARALEALPDEASREEAVKQHVDNMLVSACRAAAALGDPTLVPALQALRRDDPSMKVKSAALDALHDMGVDPEMS